MDSRFGYDTDLYAWSQQQAEVLRGMASRRRDLPNDLDLDHVAEEIEDLGKSELRTVQSHLRQMLSHLVKLASSPGSASAAGWKTEILDHQELARDHLTNAMRKDVDMEATWRRARSDAFRKLAIYGEQMAQMPESCPWSLDELLSDEVEVNDLAARIAAPDA